VSGATLNEDGIYTLTLSAQVDGLQADSQFNIYISDPCMYATFMPTTLPSLTLIRNFDTTVSASFWVQTDVEQNFSVLCNFVATLVTPSLYASVSDTTIQLDESLLDAADAGIQTLMIEVTSLEYPNSVTAAQYTFTVDIQECNTNSFSFPVTLQDLSVYLHQAAETVTFQRAEWSDLACRLEESYSVDVKLNGSTQNVSWLIFNEQN
jgi:archaellum component FlaG (FlaF/FlaG flagellin family)